MTQPSVIISLMTKAVVAQTSKKGLKITQYISGILGVNNASLYAISNPPIWATRSPKGFGIHPPTAQKRRTFVMRGTLGHTVLLTRMILNWHSKNVFIFVNSTTLQGKSSIIRTQSGEGKAPSHILYMPRLIRKRMHIRFNSEDDSPRLSLFCPVGQVIQCGLKVG